MSADHYAASLAQADRIMDAVEASLVRAREAKAAAALWVWIPVTLAGDAEPDNVLGRQWARPAALNTVTVRLDLNDDDGAITWTPGAPWQVAKRKPLWRDGGEVILDAAGLLESRAWAALAKRIRENPEDYCEDEAQGLALARAREAEREP